MNVADALPHSLWGETRQIYQRTLNAGSPSPGAAAMYHWVKPYLIVSHFCCSAVAARPGTSSLHRGSSPVRGWHRGVRTSASRWKDPHLLRATDWQGASWTAQALWVRWRGLPQCGPVRECRRPRVRFAWPHKAGVLEVHRGQRPVLDPCPEHRTSNHSSLQLCQSPR